MLFSRLSQPFSLFKKVNQVCWQRTTSVSVPGCIGDASVLGDTEEDFCVFDPDLFIEE